MTRHIRLSGARRADREEWIARNIRQSLIVRCHQRLRGPYTGVDTVLGTVLPEAVRRWPELVELHRFEILYGMPELEEIIGPAPRTLASDAPFKERTRFFASDMIRCMNQGIASFLIAHSARMLAAGLPMRTLVFDEIHAAEPTTCELVALLMRRADPVALPLVVSGAAVTLPAELEAELSLRADSVICPPAGRSAVRRTPSELSSAYVAGHGTSDDPEEIDAYQRSDPRTRARLHDEQADRLEPDAGPGLRIGAIAYHREHGTDPATAGSVALAEAQQYCSEVGFSAAVVDLGMRCRAITDPVRDAKRYCDVTSQVATSLVPQGRLDESMSLYLELRRLYPLPKVHMTTSYAIAMLYTRFLQPRDHETAIEWQNNAAAIASILPDARERLVFGVFQDNALALIEMHRGNLRHALELVESGMARLDAEIGDDEWVLHRSQLLYNSARLKVALGDADAAYADFTTLIEMDPYYTDYLCERAKISRKAGDFDAALADYDRAVRLAPPFPELYYNRGTARTAVGDIEGALADYGYVLDMEPDDVDTRLSRAELLVAEGELAAAMADVEAGLSLRPAEPRLLCMKGTIALELGELGVALVSMDGAIALDPQYAAALLNRAVAHYRSGRSDLAVDDLTRTLKITGEDPDIMLNRGLAYLETGQADLALADVDRALALPGADVTELRRLREACLDRLPGSDSVTAAR
ncbi:MAG TPA: tetratricopeptide repeat protein [Streptosporangiaceae bacterium]|nr:tetratricopeptide repeat protein [Streptosporangiaceae bacterium]